MNSFDWNRLAVASVLSCSVFGVAWGISWTLIPDSAPVQSAFAQEQTETLDLTHADLQNGQAIAAQQCGLCHSFQQNGPDKIGPPLFDIKHRKIATLANFTYSASLKQHQNESWTVKNLNSWLKNPREFAPATMMAYPGLSSVNDRRDVIAYLNSLTPASK